MNKKLLKAYGGFMWANVFWVILALAFNAMSGWSLSMAVIYLQRITDTLEQNLRDGLILLIVMGLSFKVFGYIFRWLGAVVPDYISNKFCCEIRLKLVSHLQKIPFHKFEEKKAGDLYSVIRNDSGLAGQWFYTALSRMAGNVALFIFSVLIMIGINPGAALVIIVIVVGATFINNLILKRVTPHYKDSRRHLGRMTHSLERTFEGLETIKTYKAKEFALSGFSDKNYDYCESRRKAVDIDAMRLGWSTLIEKTSLYGPLIYLGHLGIIGQMSIGHVIVFTYLVKTIITPIEVIFRWMPRMLEQLTGWGRIQEILDIPVEDEAGSIPSMDIVSVSAQNLTYMYEENEPVFSGVDITLSKGTITELEGSSGSGKTTLLKLLMGLYQSKVTKYTADDKPVDDLAPYIAYSSLENTLFPVSVYENLTMGISGVSEEKCMEVLDGLGFGEWIRSFPQGLDTLLPDGISGGQKQAISVARALLSGKPVLLLDEPFSALDKDKESLFLREISRSKHDRAILLTSHRKFLEDKWDAVIKLE